MLCNVEQVYAIPGMTNSAAVPIPWLNALIGAADAAVKSYLKRDIELQAYVEFYDGNEQRELTIKQFPVWTGQTLIAAASDGVPLPTGTINVLSTSGFHPGIIGNPNATPPTIGIQTGVSTWTSVTYTGTTPTSFTGCSGGFGTLAMNLMVNHPTVFFDPGGYYGQSANAFATAAPGNPNSTQMVLGTQYVLHLDRGGKMSHRGTLTRIGGVGQGFVGFSPEILWSGKLGARRLPCWPRGDGNIKVCYTAGYAPGKVPQDLSFATAMLVAYMTRNQPTGSPLSSESLGNYSYNVLQASVEIPELGAMHQIFSRYRESSW